MYNLMEYSDNYSKTSVHEPTLDNNNDIANVTVANSITDSFKIKEKMLKLWYH